MLLAVGDGFSCLRSFPVALPTLILKRGVLRRASVRFVLMSASWRSPGLDLLAEGTGVSSAAEVRPDARGGGVARLRVVFGPTGVFGDGGGLLVLGDVCPGQGGDVLRKQGERSSIARRPVTSYQTSEAVLVARLHGIEFAGPRRVSVLRGS